MAYFWQLGAASDLDVTLDEQWHPQFESQKMAEEWLQLTYEELGELSVTQVTLMEEDRVVYGPMSLLA